MCINHWKPNLFFFHPSQFKFALANTNRTTQEQFLQKESKTNLCLVKQNETNEKRHSALNTLSLKDFSTLIT